MIKNTSHVLKFQRLFEKNCDENEAYQILCSLKPSCLSTVQLMEILDWVEKSAIRKGRLPNHVNIFGTGGDCSNDIFGKTLNISSLAATIASQTTTLIKLGTRGVTAKWGSADFFKRVAEIATKEYFPFVLKPPSRFIPLSELGFRYSDNIILARRRIFKENRLDIFKVIFPFANLTHSYGQVNGISRFEYVDIFSALASQRPKSRILLIHNEDGHDELLPGHNKLIFHYQGKVITADLEIPRVSKNIERLFHQRNTLDEQILAARELLENDQTQDFLLDILCLNAATIVVLDYWHNFSSILVTDMAKKLKQEFIKNYDYQFR